MTDDRAEEETLKAAFQGLGGADRHECSSDDLDRVWRALDGTLEAEERRELIDRLATDPALAEAWRVAQELRAAGGLGVDARATPLRQPTAGWQRGWLAAAAVVLAAIGAVFVFQRMRPADETFRTADGYSVESLVGDVTLPRNDFRLRWRPGPPDTRYQVRVTTEDLQVLAIAADLPAAEYVVPSDALAPVASGGRVLWQVDARLPGGERVSSATFTTPVR